MAKRKKVAPKKSYRRRKKSMGSVGINEVLFMAGGAVASRLVVNALGKFAPFLTSTPVIKGATQAALGLVTKPLAGVIGIKSPNLTAFGNGMSVAGAYELTKALIPAVMGQAEESDVIVISGSGELSELNGMDEIGGSGEMAELNGMDEIGAYMNEYEF
jgi:hypothetical protein